MKRTWRLARRLHRDYPADGWWSAWKTARLIREIASQPKLTPLTETGTVRAGRHVRLGLAACDDGGCPMTDRDSPFDDRSCEDVVGASSSERVSRPGVEHRPAKTEDAGSNPASPPSHNSPIADASYVAWYGRGRKQNWTTPRSLFDPLHDEYGFTMDGASEPGNGLLDRASSADAPLPWEGERVFCNPPWSNIPPFVEQAASAELAVLLVPARTNARWFHRALELGATVRFFLGRPSFGSGPDDQKGHNSPVDCVLLVFTRSTAIQAVAA